MTSRILVVEDDTVHDFKIEIPAGAWLGPSILSVLALEGISYAQLECQSGELDEAVYHVAPPEPTGRTLVAYGEGIVLNRVTLIGANAVVGRNADGAAIIHCHGFISEASGKLHGGHLNLPRCRVGNKGLSLRGVATRRSGFVSALDRTSRLHVFHPVREACADGR
ncbi:hypothetical protein [Parapusillimonas granuli]|uniref:DUF296 domain-containing protein n=1 Tax=Parapusillimonas granuli TaxID=380911 RepID=A0A853FZ49_9BURK|nr:hypothetical protein [Parapusillimonas granuli]MBB5214660.1 hypothetical protein [Parapusillimonas granuli]NYT48932.1 hypothetical protein [Parapusillimonas granuli]